MLLQSVNLAGSCSGGNSNLISLPDVGGKPFLPFPCEGNLPRPPPISLSAISSLNQPLPLPLPLPRPLPHPL